MNPGTSFRTHGRVRSAVSIGSCRSPHQMQMFWSRLGIGDAEAAAVLQRRHGPSRGLDLGGIDLRQEYAGLAAALGEDFAPGRDDQRRTEGLALVLVQAGLRRREHETAGLDGACPEQYVPMRSAGLPRA